jgi:hypothetical protein
MGYWGRFWKRVWKDFAEATVEQMIGALLALCILCYQIKFGVIHSGEIYANYKALVCPYLILLVVLFLWHLARAPYLLHLETVKNDEEKLKSAVQEERKRKLSDASRSEWLDLADRFKALSYHRADWSTSQDKTTWRIPDKECRPLCVLAGSLVLRSPSLPEDFPRSLLLEPDFSVRWLEYIKTKCGSNHTVPYMWEESPDGKKIGYFGGSIEIPVNSSNLCIELASYCASGVPV